MMTPEQHTLLEKHNVVILPGSINHDAYELVAEALLYSADFKLYCRGSGGSTWDGRAIVDLLQSGSRVTGHLMGAAASCHGVIWLGCPQRVVYPNSLLALHTASISTDHELNAISFKFACTEMEEDDALLARLLASYTKRTVKYWLKEIQRPGSIMTNNIPAKRLVEEGIAIWKE